MALPRIQTLILKKLHELECLTREEMEEIVNAPQDLSGRAMESLLADRYHVSELKILIAKSRAFDLNPFIAKRFKVTSHTFEKLDPGFCSEHGVLPIGVLGETFIIALSNPFELQVTRKVKELTKCNVSALLALPGDINRLLEKTKGQREHESQGFGDVVEALGDEMDMDVADISDDALEDEDSAPIVQLANRIIEEAFFAGASDIHIEPAEKECRVRIRVDGVCYKKIVFPLKVAIVLVTRLKVMANLDIAEKRLPQDGRIIFRQFTKKDIDIDLRVSTSPLNNGEGMVMRILDKQKSTLPLKELGFEPENLSEYQKCVQRPFGMILHCGPTGSGKSMTLYSALNYINDPSIVIRTAEDPIEYTLPGLCQVQMNRKIGLTFANALRAFLRQDPDVILVGEIRDQETAGIAVEAALTGHLLFSTLHTNDAATTIARLTEMGIEPFMISGSLICICAQRLMRRVCSVCKQPYDPEAREKDILEKSIGWSGTIYRANPAGCPNCGRSGYRGRVGIHELMINNETLIEKINANSEAVVLKRAAMMHGMRTLHQDSMRKVRSGLSTIEEAITTVPPDLEDLEAIKEEFELEQHMLHKRNLDRKTKLRDLKGEIV